MRSITLQPLLWSPTGRDIGDLRDERSTASSLPLVQLNISIGGWRVSGGWRVGGGWRVSGGWRWGLEVGAGGGSWRVSGGWRVSRDRRVH